MSKVYDVTSPAINGVSIIVATALSNDKDCRGVYIGTDGSYDFTFDGTTWITFQGCVAGTILPISVVGARVTSGAAAPTAGDIVFLY